VRHAGRHLAERAELLGAYELILRRGQLAVGSRALLEEPGAPQRQRGEVTDARQETLVGLAEGRVGLRNVRTPMTISPGSSDAEPVPRIGKVSTGAPRAERTRR
jgi:hypothetical protein